MPRADLAESGVALLRAAVADEETVARFHAKIVTLRGPGSCRLWASAVAGRGHGRLWLGTVEGRDVVVIAHRFSWALTHGVDDLLATPLLGHRCDNPLCQLVGHVQASNAWRNRKEWLMRRHTIAGPLRDTRGARGRARAGVRAAYGDQHVAETEVAVHDVAAAVLASDVAV